MASRGLQDGEKELQSLLYDCKLGLKGQQASKPGKGRVRSAKAKPKAKPKPSKQDEGSAWNLLKKWGKKGK